MSCHRVATSGPGALGLRRTDFGLCILGKQELSKAAQPLVATRAGRDRAWSSNGRREMSFEKAFSAVVIASPWASHARPQMALAEHSEKTF
jgi:hypothetical protein